MSRNSLVVLPVKGISIALCITFFLGFIAGNNL